MKAPSLLAPAGSLDAVRAAIANGADAVYLGVEKFNARDEGAQFTFEELERACAMARSRGVRVYLTLNILLKPSELEHALLHLGQAIDRGIHAVIVQDLGLIRLIQRVYPGFEIHGSTQMTVHDASGARLAHDLGLDRVVMARENTLGDLSAVREAAPGLGMETFVHGALCISYSGQCLMSGMISERSANRGSCAQSCRKDYVLTDDATGDTLDRGYLISARDLAAYDVLPDLAGIGVSCVKIEGRKKKPEYVAIAVGKYREFLDRQDDKDRRAPGDADVQPLVQIYSRGFTRGMYHGRGGRDYVTRTQSDNIGTELGLVAGWERGELVIEVREAVRPGDGLGFEPPPGSGASSTGFSVDAVRTLAIRDGIVRQSIAARTRVPVGWRVVRSSQAALLERARESFSGLGASSPSRIRLDVRMAGSRGSVLTASFRADGSEVTVCGAMPLTPAISHELGDSILREHLGRLGTTPFVLGAVDRSGLDAGLFVPLSELNRIRQQAVEQLTALRDRAERERLMARAEAVRVAVSDVPGKLPATGIGVTLVAEVYRVEDARSAASSGAREIVLDPFLRHPLPPVSRVRALAAELVWCSGSGLRLSSGPRTGRHSTSGWLSTFLYSLDTWDSPASWPPQAGMWSPTMPSTASTSTRPRNCSRGAYAGSLLR